jgi:phosphatidylinositol phospholipase C delta
MSVSPSPPCPLSLLLILSLGFLGQAIAKYAFVSSPYPVLLSCEVHCGLVQQDMLVDIMTQAFGPALVKAPLEEHVTKIVALPSPEQLKGRILVKVSLCFRPTSRS